MGRSSGSGGSLSCGACGLSPQEPSSQTTKMSDDDLTSLCSHFSILASSSVSFQYSVIQTAAYKLMNFFTLALAACRVQAQLISPQTTAALHCSILSHCFSRITQSAYLPATVHVALTYLSLSRSPAIYCVHIHCAVALW